MTAYFVVRAVVPEPDRANFDHWYHTQHLPDAIRAFSAQRAWRGWSRTDPSLHYAFYQFADTTALEAATTPQAIRPLVAEFDNRWGTRVSRTREIIELTADQLP
jgi:hypothetical protein